MGSERWSRTAKWVVGLLLALNFVGAVGTVAELWAPSAVAKEAKISVQRDEIETLRRQIRRLEEHRAALDSYERAKEQWEREKATEQAFREQTARWQSEVMGRLSVIEGCCHDGG